MGTLVAATLPVALSLAVFDGWLRPLLVLILVAGLELMTANFAGRVQTDPRTVPETQAGHLLLGIQR